VGGWEVLPLDICTQTVARRENSHLFDVTGKKLTITAGLVTDGQETP